MAEEIKIAQPKGARSITDERMKLAEFMRQDWVVNAEEGTTLEELQDPVYWSHMAPALQQFDHIEVREETGAWVATLMVLRAERTLAIVKLLDHTPLGAADEEFKASATYVVKYSGPHHRYRVIRASDGAVVQSGLFDKRAANDWIEQFEKAVRA